MSFSDILAPRPEVLRKGGIEGVIDIENLRDKRRRTIESRPENFFELTFPTSDIRTVLENLHQRFNSNERTAGLFLLEGYKGSGKSHLELLVYHLFKNSEVATNWLKRHKVFCSLPQDAIVLIHKFTDFPLDSIWELIFSNFGVEDKTLQERVPNLDEFQQALNGRRLVLIFDELERGIKSISNESFREQNLAFLQMLSEESLRTENASVTIFASVYDSRQEPGATLKRVPRIDVKFSDPKDRQRVVLHRLFSNYLQIQKRDIESVIQSYVNFWKRHQILVDEKYIEELFHSFPFTPELLEMILFRVPASGGFQGPRGALGLLGAVVRNIHGKADILTAAHLNIDETGIRNRLSDLDPGQKILQCAQNDLRDLRDAPLVREIIGSVLMATLTSSTHDPGIDEQTLARQVLKPGDDINQYLGTLQALVKLGTYFQVHEGNYFFDEHEKPNAKVEYRSLRIDASRALEYALDTWRRQLFQDSKAVVFRDIDQVRSELSLLAANELRFVLAPKRLSPTERAQIFHGAENRNQIILLEPKADTFNGLENPDILKWSQRAIAVSDLQTTASDVERKRQYERIGREDTNYILDAFKRAGLVFVWMQPDPNTPAGFYGELESLGAAVTREDVRRQLQENVFPRQRFEEHLLEILPHIMGKTVAEVDSAYKKTLGFPVRIAVTTVLSALKNLCQQRHIGLRHEKDSACGRYPDLTSDELLQAKIVEPFEDPNASAVTLGSEQPKPGEEIAPGGIAGEHDWEEVPDEVLIESTKDIETVRTTFMDSLATLRQEIAQKLSDFPEAKIHAAQFFILSQLEHVDLSTLPSAVRGTLTGTGAIAIDIGIKKQGEFTKAQIEQMIETLPSFPGAQYRVELKVEKNNQEEK